MAVRIAIDKDVDSIKRIADANRPSLGFSPRPVFTQSIKHEELIVADDSAAVMGFCHFHVRRDHVAKIYQICVADEYRRLGIGTTIVEFLVQTATARRATQVSLLCPENLTANDFYSSIGFVDTGFQEGKKRRLRKWKIMLVNQ